MTLKIPLINIDDGVATPPESCAVDMVAFKFDPVDLNMSRLSSRIKDLIRNSDGVKDHYDGDHSRAVFAACIAMNENNFSDQEIATVLTDRENYLAETAYRHANTTNRDRAAKWILEQNLAKAKAVTGREHAFKNETEISDIGNDHRRSQAGRKLNLTFERFEEIILDTNSSALVEDLIEHKSLVLIVSETNVGKTFFTLDLGFSVAQGKVWHGRKVEMGAVLYVAAEGGVGSRKRIIAYRQAHKLEKTPMAFRLASGTINLLDPKADTMALIQEIKQTEKLFGVPVRMVVIDTLSRALSGGDENSSEDMGAFVKCADMIRVESGATIVIVHHRGKNQDKGARGHSLLKGAVDTEITIEAKTGEDFKTAKVTKQRDYEYPPPFAFRLAKVEIGKTNEGKSITSCVVEPVNLFVLESFGAKPIRGVALKAFETLKGIIKSSPIDSPKSLPWSDDACVAIKSTWQKAFTAQHYEAKARQTAHDAFTRAIKLLSASGHIEIQGQYVRILSGCPEMSGFGENRTTPNVRSGPYPPLGVRTAKDRPQEWMIQESQSPLGGISADWSHSPIILGKPDPQEEPLADDILG